MAKRIHFFNQNYFEEIKTPEQAYWLGFIAADGHVRTENSCGLYIGLAIKDIEHLYKLHKALGCGKNTKIKIFKDKNNHKSCRLALYSKKLASDLANKGILQQKSFTLKAWNGPQEFLRHYWRGMFDGDGGFSSHTKQKKTVRYTTWAASLVGTKDIVSKFGKFIRQSKFKYTYGRIAAHASIYQISYGGIQPSKTIAFTLYHEGDIALTRKEILANKIKNWKMCDLKIKNHYTKENLLPLYEKTGSWIKVAKKLKISPNGLYKHVRKLKLPLKRWPCVENLLSFK